MVKNTILVFSFIIIFFISSCASQSNSIAVSTSTLNGKTFQLINMFEGMGITISFYDEEFYGYSGFNTYLGKYEMRRGNMIIFKDMVVTKMGGQSEAVEIEKQYIELLNKASSIEFSSNSLTIITLDNERLVFKRIK